MKPWGICLLSARFVIGATQAQDAALPRLPELYIFHYQPLRRDPFISSAAQRTLVSSEGSVRGIISGSVVQEYLRTITEAIKRELFIGGLSVGDEKTRSMALINGVPFVQGAKIPLPIQTPQLMQLDELARTYGLPLEISDANHDSILVEVGEVRSNGVSIVLPGFKAAVCELPYEGDTTPEPIHLERKHSPP